jgi:diguanylate cyclase (GGDEF)-like protein
MAGRDAAQGGLGTRVALRTFALFGLSSALPVALFALIGFFFVSEELEHGARAQLEQASKRYGITLNERLIQAETLMLEAARIELENEHAGANSFSLLHRMQMLTPLSGGAVRIDERPIAAHETRLPAGWSASRALQADVAGGVPRMRLLVTVSDGTREVRLVTDPTSRSFWDAEGALPDSRFCVYVRERPLHCSAGAEGDTDEPALQAEWTLFLKPRFGADSWSIRAQQPRSVAFAALGSFRVTLPVVALIAIAGALLLSFTHIRRLHRPLALLAAAARRMSRGRFGEQVQIVSDDEFASVARALNTLGDRLKRQFSFLSTLAHIDRRILQHPTFAPVVGTLLPRMPRLLGCRAAAVLLDAHGDTPAQLHLYRGGAGSGVETIPLAKLDALDGACRDIGTWLPSPIAVNGASRGTLLAGYTAGTRAGARARRQLRGLAHRLAVALGNEDRERALLRHAYFDPLTALPNRQLFRDRIDQELLRSRRDLRNVALLYIDLDHFKNFNDSLGHSAGDALLSAVAGRLREALREGDTLARLGGDEFAFVCPGAHSEQAAALASRALALLQKPFDCDGAQFTLQASVGVAIYPANGDDTERLLRNAHSAMYRAKQAGRGRVAFFEEGMNEHAERRMLVERRLRLALAQGGLTMAFQPKFRGAGCQLQGFEALARWEDAELGRVAPVEFITVAEETGLIDALGGFALHEACRWLREWQLQGLDVPQVAVNVAVHQLRDPAFPSQVARCLVEHGLQGSALQLEITESTLATDDPGVVRALSAIRALGVEIAMDDFGTGYSSMASLRELPIDVLKIDRSFVLRCCDSEVDEALLRGLIELAHTLGKTVVAEGVETQSQLGLLQELGCDVVQGYLLGRPLPVAAVAQFVTHDAARIASASQEADATVVMPAMRAVNE